MQVSKLTPPANCCVRLLTCCQNILDLLSNNALSISRSFFNLFFKILFISAKYFLSIRLIPTKSSVQNNKIKRKFPSKMYFLLLVVHTMQQCTPSAMIFRDNYTRHINTRAWKKTHKMGCFSFETLAVRTF